MVFYKMTSSSNKIEHEHTVRVNAFVDGRLWIPQINMN